MNQIRKYGIWLIPMIIIVLIFSFLFSRKTQTNRITGKEQHISITPQEEIVLGLQCAPDAAAQFGGLDSDISTQNRIKKVGQKLVSVPQVRRSPYQFDFHVLSDSQSIDAFSLPGGQIFITNGLFKLLKTDNELAAILSHEIGHVIGRHVTEKLSGYNILEEFKDSSNVSKEYSPSQISNYVSDILQVTFNSKEEAEADDLGMKFLIAAGYNSGSMRDISNRFKKDPNAEDFGSRHF